MWTLKIEADAVIQDPLPCLCAHKQGRGFFGSLFGPRCLCQNFATAAGALVLVAQYLAAPGSLLRGLCWNQRFRPFCACVPPLVRGYCKIFECKKNKTQQNSTKLGPTCSYRKRPNLNAKTAKLSKTEQNSYLPAELKSDQIWMQKQQNSAKLGPTFRAQKRSNLNAKTAKLSKTQKNSDLPAELKSDQIWMQKQQNSTKLNKTQQNSPCRPP